MSVSKILLFIPSVILSILGFLFLKIMESVALFLSDLAINLATLEDRFRTFFTFSNEIVPYKIFKVISVIIFFAPFVVVCISEFLILSIFKGVGMLITKILANPLTLILSLALGYVFGFVYLVLMNIFRVLIMLCNIPELLYYA